MRFICYLSEPQYQLVEKTLSIHSCKNNFLSGSKCVYPPPQNIIAQEGLDSFNLGLDTGKDVVLIDSSWYSQYSSIAIYCIYARKIPVYLCCDETCSDVVRNSLIQDHPLLEIGGLDTMLNYITSFSGDGKLVSFEGGDGVGKQTQTALMGKKLEKLGYIVKTIDFPHDKAACGKIIRKVLRGDFGTIGEVNPILFASLYGFNRADMKGILDYWLRRGYIVLLDRYIEANYGHQISKIDSEAEKEALLHSLMSFEHRWLALPQSDIVLYLDLPPTVAATALTGDATRMNLDIHETASGGYKEQVRQTFLWCSRKLDNWQVINCLRSNEETRDKPLRLTIEEVHTLCLESVMKKL